MSQQPSTFGQAANPVRPPTPTPDASGSRRTVVLLSVAGAVVALGVLGGAAALVLGGEPDDLGPIAGPVTPVVEPSVEASPEPVLALPTAAVQGRNIFVPLVAAAGQDGGEAASAPVEDTSADDSGTSEEEASGGTGGSGTAARTGTTTSTPAGAAAATALKSRPGTGTSLVLAPQGSELTALQAQLAERDAEITRLRTALSDLGVLLTPEAAGRLRASLATAESERATLAIAVAGLRAELAAVTRYEDDLVFVSVEPGVPAGPGEPAEPDVLTVELNGEELTVTEGDTFDRDDRGELPDRFTFHAYDETEQTVAFGFVSTTYTIDVSGEEPVRLGLG